MADESSGAGLFESLDPARQKEFNDYYVAQEKGLIRRASSMLEDSGLFETWDERKDAAWSCAQKAYIRLLRAMCQRTKPFLTDTSDPVYVKDWLYWVTENFARMKIRAIRPRVKKLPPPMSLDALHDVQGIDVASEDNLEDKAHIDDLLERLDPTDAKSIRLKYQGKYSSDEIASILGTTAGAVRQRQVRTLRKLKELHNRE